MKRVLLFLVLCYALNSNAQNYLIDFEGSGASTSVTAVKVENLTSGSTVTLNGSDVLRLTLATAINTVEKDQSSGIKIYPNPMTDNALIEINPPVSGRAVISLYEMNGKLVARSNNDFGNSIQKFHLSGIKSGLYLINVKGSTYQYSGKLMCNAQEAGTIIMKKIDTDQTTVEKISKSGTKGTQAYVDMIYTTGDKLKFTGSYDIYSTIVTDIPSADKTITFNFVACTDGDNNNYPTVQIGTQIWMAENLKTTKYNGGSDVHLVSDNAAWAGLTDPGYCWYSNDEATYKNIYGALYNWYAANSGTLCPSGWHVPAESEWIDMGAFLGGAEEVGFKLKETGFLHWYTPNTGATNESGWTGLPGGYRDYSTGAYSGLTYYGIWWTGEEYSATTGSAGILYYNSSIIDGDEYRKSFGYSVRCLKD